ncbi:hypothetical protein [Marinobacter sp. C2H3]|uniref:hypothetical protein n=1 Tax=Marinobacter sp. C2H3 TaxID=3119003 RepID=UPI00300EF03E
MTTTGKVSEGSVFKRALRNDRPARLLEKWAAKSFYTLFAVDTIGRERALILPYGRAMAMLITLNKAEADRLAASLDIQDHTLTPMVKPIPLWELARYAHNHSGALAWAKEGLLVPDETVDLLAHHAVVSDMEEAEALIRIEVVPIDEGSEGPLATGDLQWWTRRSGSKAPNRQLIYNDHHPWTGNPQMPDLPPSARPLSSLTPDERRVFDRRANPELPLNHPADLGRTGADATSALPPHKWLTAGRLAGPRKLLHLIEQQTFSNPNHFMLEVTPKRISGGNAGAGNLPAQRIDLAVVYLDHSHTSNNITPWLIAEDSLTEKELSALPYRVPTAPGMHPLPEALLGLVKRRLAWELFAKSRELDNQALPPENLMRHPFVARAVNADKPFVYDPNDKQFPFLAGFRWGKKLTPVMVLGQLDGNLACQPLANIVIPGGSVPTALPGRHLLPNGGRLKVRARSGCFLAPQQLVECPDGWYRGARISPSQTVKAMRNELIPLDRALVRSDHDPDGIPRFRGIKLLGLAGGITALALLIGTLIGP